MTSDISDICDLGKMKLTSPSTIKYIMGKYGFRFSKGLGQNFLVSEGTVEKIIEACAINGDDCIVEVGPGIGVMTRAICERAKKVISFEIDKSLMPVLEETLRCAENVMFVFEDVLKADLNAVMTREFGDVSAKVIANLPYYVTSPIIMTFLENNLNISEITVMVQKEVATRMTANPGNKDYGTLSVAVRFYAEPEIIASVSRNCFMPCPNVDSAVVRLRTREYNFVEKLESRDVFFKVVKSAFSKRRKTVINSMSGELGLSKEELRECLIKSGIDESRRGETLDLDEFGVLSNRVSEYRRKKQC